MADFDIFNLSVNDVETHKAAASNTNDVIYKPSADDGMDGTYKALIRFVPNPENPRKSLVRKYVHWLTDPSGSGRLVDSPTSVGEKCPIQDAFFRLRKSDSAIDRKMSEKLKRREQYYSLIKIIKDPQNPSMEGQYMIYKFGYKIKEKIDEELSPAFGEPTQVFDLFEGKNFELIITRQGDYNNYDKSKFSASTSPIMVGDSPAERTPESMQAIKAELESAPSLSTYEYKPWDDSVRDFVNQVLSQYVTNPGRSMGSVTAPASAPTPTATTVTETAPTPAQPAASATVSDDDDLDSFLDGLDI